MEDTTNSRKISVYPPEGMQEKAPFYLAVKEMQALKLDVPVEDCFFEYCSNAPLIEGQDYLKTSVLSRLNIDGRFVVKEVPVAFFFYTYRIWVDEDGKGWKMLGHPKRVAAYRGLLQQHIPGVLLTTGQE